MEGLSQLLSDILSATKAEYHTGPVPIKISKKGNWEPMQKEIQEALEKVAFDEGFIMRNLNILHDDDDDSGGFTRITANCLDADTIQDYIVQLEGRNTPESHNRLASALNKAIKLLDNYNNMYGDTMNKTIEIIELDEILKLNT
jgi:hypothetical protein